jgi:hypothetical protein
MKGIVLSIFVGLGLWYVAGSQAFKNTEIGIGQALIQMGGAVK